ncbi:peptide-N(4)-(N-acetyl-beta-glucosaminyl)asparagine amidase isoform X2 [Nymphaea colorata]|uniref:peptide-N(4)-(N-acetyl-beta- glucosaminyl)asparagine amidase isoform X2 n=1 Tax=Nymphaea colorata TaxID=210225 RepID=UPI00129D912F|nr:peptide-N(4)-(N-acetyl-beta-glucosaminyl)asparagine amidase isoform X2 [Nymphaea colorata]
MVARKLLVRHNSAQFDVDYETDDGLEVLKYQLFSLTLVPPEDQKLVGAGNRAIREDADLNSMTELQLVTGGEGVGSSLSTEKSDEELARMLQAEEEALFFQQYQHDQGTVGFEQRVRPYISQVLMYEDHSRQEAARKTVPMDELEEQALISLAKEGNFKPSKIEQDHAILLQLLFWFKKSFRWVNAPPCETCGCETNNVGMGVPFASESNFGGSRVELYRCKICSKVTRFPRYNDPLKLLETRRGRCGEWANCFTLYCRSLGYESRLILSFTDHVWTECFSNSLGRWMHLDPCEGVYDNPLLYEKGWGKQLDYVIALSKDGVFDVTKRYTRKWHEVLSRRHITSEANATIVLSRLTKECRRGLNPIALAALEERDRKEAKELSREIHLQDESVSLPQRRSGAKEWRLARSEVELNYDTSLGCTSCPIRNCVDDHVSRIYNILCSLLTEWIDAGISKAETVDYLYTLKDLMLNLKSMSFRSRSAMLKSSSNGSENQLWAMASIKDLFSSLSLKTGLELDNKLHISLNDDPVRTALTLPVILDALDEMIQNLHGVVVFSKGFLHLPLAKHSRISSGSVIASGEELPSGIATSAFDGLRLSKWEEPNGAKGCWIEYRTLNGEMHELQAYELMSANDAPERDPMDWVLEGSNNMGSSWFILDTRSSQMFQERFMRKAFMIEPSKRCKSNAFRWEALIFMQEKCVS